MSAREPVECIESGMDGSGCQGPVAVREALSGTGRLISGVQAGMIDVNDGPQYCRLG